MSNEFRKILFVSVKSDVEQLDVSINNDNIVS